MKLLQTENVGIDSGGMHRTFQSSHVKLPFKLYVFLTFLIGKVSAGIM